MNFNISNTFWSILYSRQRTVSEDISLPYQVLRPISNTELSISHVKVKTKLSFWMSWMYMEARRY